MLSPSHTSEQIQAHLYQSFLTGATSDVSLRCTGSWSAVYALHKVVLIQAGFFRSLFTSGWRESWGTKDTVDTINLRFDDPNITRAAFEVCLASLYGGGPTLYVPPDLLSTVVHPLTRSFPYPHSSEPIPPGYHPATPRFLLSLIATSTYLSIPAESSHALSLMMQSIGPFTVMRYLDFAIGRGIGDVIGDEPVSAVGLEHVGKEVKDSDTVPQMGTPRSSFSVPPNPNCGLNGNGEAAGEKSNGLVPNEDDMWDDRASTYTIGTHVSDDKFSTSTARPAHYFYGTVSNHIGEACACWLSRWGCDMLQYEEAVMAATRTPPTNGPASALRFYPYGKHDLLLPQDRANTPSSTSNSGRGSHPVIWAPGGLSMRWVRGIISSDSFFVANELERYRFAMRVSRFRQTMIGDVDSRSAKEREADQREWDELFRTGIYYSHMTFEELREIEKDRMVALQTLAMAHWTQSVFRGLITARPFSSHSASSSPLPRPNSPPSPSPLTTPRELGIVRKTAEIREALNSASQSQGGEDEARKTYFPVLTDRSDRIGDNFSMASTIARSNSLLFGPESPQPPVSGDDKPKKPRQIGDENSFFGLATSRRTARQIVSDDPTSKAQWTEFEPFRFATEWWGVHTLKEKAKLNSVTVSYAGSWFNVYAQVARRKGLQLGVYLNRQSMVDPIPIPSGPPGTRERAHTTSSLTSPINNLSSNGAGQITRYSPFTGAVSTSSPSPYAHPSSSTPRLASPLSTSTSMSNLRSGSSNAVTHAQYRPTSPLSSNVPKVEFRDPRPIIRAYFSITCPSATGTSATMFSSGPDDFGVSQSWGWKSSTCLEIPVTEVELENEGDESSGEMNPNPVSSSSGATADHSSVARWLAELRSVRGTVIIGVV